MKLAFLASTSAIAVYAAATAVTPRTPAPQDAPLVAPSSPRTDAQARLSSLWVKHSIVARAYLGAAVSGSTLTPELETRLQRSRRDLRNAIAEVRGANVTDSLSTHATSHLTIETTLISALQRGDTGAAHELRRMHPPQ